MEENEQIYVLADRITCRKDFELFLQKLTENFSEKKDDWENDS